MYPIARHNNARALMGPCMLTSPANACRSRLLLSREQKEKRGQHKKVGPRLQPGPQERRSALSTLRVRPGKCTSTTPPPEPAECRWVQLRRMFSTTWNPHAARRNAELPPRNPHPGSPCAADPPATRRPGGCGPDPRQAMRRSGRHELELVACRSGRRPRTQARDSGPTLHPLGCGRCAGFLAGPRGCTCMRRCRCDRARQAGQQRRPSQAQPSRPGGGLIHARPSTLRRSGAGPGHA
jgi:hypothetical protein